MPSDFCCCHCQHYCAILIVVIIIIVNAFSSYCDCNCVDIESYSVYSIDFVLVRLLLKCFCHLLSCFSMSQHFVMH